MFLNGAGIPDRDARGERVVDDSFLMCFNAHHESIDFTLPGEDYAQSWEVSLDTAAPLLREFRSAKGGGTVTLEGRSMLVLRKVY